MSIAFPTSTFRGQPGGLGVALEENTDGTFAARLATAADKWEDIYGWTQGASILSRDPPYADISKKVAVVSMGPLVGNVDCFAPDTFYSTHRTIGTVVYYSPSLQKITVEKGADGLFIGEVRTLDVRYGTRNNQRSDVTLAYNNYVHATLPDPTTVNLDLTIDLDDTDRPSGFGDRRIVIAGDEGLWSTDETLTVQGGGTTLATLDQGSAVMYELETATKNDDDTWNMTWKAVTGESLYLADVTLKTDYWRAQCAKRDARNAGIQAVMVASTTGQKAAWTITSDAPPATQSTLDGWLSVGGLQRGEVFKIAAKESDGTAWDSKLVSNTTLSQTWTLCGGNCSVNVGKKGIRVSHVASGAPDYTVATQVWLLRA